MTEQPMITICYYERGPKGRVDKCREDTLPLFTKDLGKEGKTFIRKENVVMIIPAYFLCY